MQELKTPEQIRRTRAVAYSYAVAASVLWGLAGPVSKYLLAHDVAAVVLTQVRETLSFFLLIVFFLVLGQRNLACVRPRDLPYLAILGVAGLAMTQISYYYAISKIQVAAAILFEYMAPVLILVYSRIFLRERLTTAKLVSLLLAVTGCALVAGAYKVDFLKLNLAGVGWGLMAAFFFSFYTLYGQAGLKKYKAMTLFAYGSGFGAVLWWFLNPPRSFFSVHYSYVVWGAFLYIALFGTILPFVFYFKSLELMEATRVSITSTLEPVVAGVAAYVALGETMAFPQVVGGVFVIVAIILLQQSPTPEAAHCAVSNGGPLA